MIKVPNLTFVNAFRFAKEMSGTILEEGDEFDFSDVHNCDPFPMLLTSMTIRKTKEESGTLMCRATHCENSYAEHMRFYRAIGIDRGRDLLENYGNSNYLPITRLEIRDLRVQGFKSKERVQEVIENKAKAMATVLSKGNDSFKKWLKYILTELMRNIPEHSKADSIWYCAQYWPSYDLVELAIMDAGIGIKESLLDNYAYGELIDNDLDAIQMAMKPGVSKAFAPGSYSLSQDEWANSGYGLYMVSHLCKELGGSFILASGDCGVKVDHDGKKNVYDTQIKGTAIQIRIKPSKIDNYEDLAKKILRQGEKTAKESSNAFKVASKSTKSLFWDGD